MRLLVRKVAAVPKALLVAAAAFLAAGCGETVAQNGGGYSYEVEEVNPHPGIAEGVPVVTIPNKGTWYACPELTLGEPTPHIKHECLRPGTDGQTIIDGYSTFAPGVVCRSGKLATLAEPVGIGYVGEPLAPASGPGSPRDLGEDCFHLR